MSVSLKESCLRILTAHSAGLVDVGTCSYSLIRPVLFGCPPDQLAEMEDRSPHLMLQSDEVWAAHLRRDYPTEPVSSPVKHTLADSLSLDSEPQEVDFPPNRVKYFEMRASKAQALINASARLRERTLANRSELGKRKAIFTGETDRGLGSRRKKLSGSRAWGTPTAPAPKTLADKARQQVKKSASIYANASRLTPAPSTSTPGFYTPRVAAPKSISASSMFTVRRSPNNPASRCVLRTTNSVVVKVVPASSLNTTPSEPLPGAVKPAPFGSKSRLAPPPIRVVKSIVPASKAATVRVPNDPIVSPRPSNASGRSVPYTPAPTPRAGPSNSLSCSPATAAEGSFTSPSANTCAVAPLKPLGVVASTASSGHSARKATPNLFMPKTKKPPPPAPTRSLVSVPGKPVDNTMSRMSQLPKR